MLTRERMKKSTHVRVDWDTKIQLCEEAKRRGFKSANQFIRFCILEDREARRRVTRWV